jgi:hypothetical protein
MIEDESIEWMRGGESKTMKQTRCLRDGKDETYWRDICQWSAVCDRKGTTDSGQ